MLSKDDNQQKGSSQVRESKPKPLASLKPQQASVDINNGVKKMPVKKELPKRQAQKMPTIAEAEERSRELDRIAKMLIKRDLALSEMREKREEELKVLEIRTQELEGGRRALMNILEDVDEERKNAEMERDKTTTILRNFVDGLLLIEQDKVSFLNVKAREFFGLTESEGIGKSITELAYHPTLSQLVKILKQEKMSPKRVTLKLSGDTVISVSAAPVVHREQEIGLMIILHDITRERLIERMKTEFVSIAAHQLRTPLSAVKWILRMILDGDLGEVPKSQAEFLEKTYQSNERMIKLVNDLLNVTRIEEGRFLHSSKPEDIIKIIEKAIAPLGEIATRKKLLFEYSAPKDKVPKIKVDAEKVALAVQNLVDNAIRYTKKGSIKVAIEFQKDKNMFLFSVADTGIGIPENQQKRVFNRFFRSSTAVKTETEGTGLGLFIAKNVVEAHGGKIWFKTAENKGSTFFFTLPVARRKELVKVAEE